MPSTCSSSSRSRNPCPAAEPAEGSVSRYLADAYLAVFSANSALVPPTTMARWYGGHAAVPSERIFSSRKREHPGRVQHGLGLLVQERLVGRPAALGHEQELVLLPAGGVDLHLGGQVAAGVLLFPHGQRRELGVPQVQRGVGVVDAARDVLLVPPVGEHVLAALAHHDGGAGVLAHGQHPPGRDARVLEQVAGHVPVVRGGLRVVQDGP